MTEARPTDLIYGHLGDPVYDTESKQWQFAREPGIGPRIEPLGWPTVVVEASRKGTEGFGPDSVQRAKQVHDLSRNCPEIAPAVGFLPELVQLSEAVHDATANYDSTVSDLFAYGNATNGTKTRTKSRQLPMIAVAAGPAGELVKLIVFNKEQLGWEGNKAFGLHAWTAANGEQGWWRGNGSPVQEIVFAEDAEGSKGATLAVRNHGAVSILQPVLRPTIVSPTTSAADRFPLPASRVDANCLASLSMYDLSGVPFADVAFNPWDHQQVATIDQAGGWSIWDLVPPKIKWLGRWTLTRNFHEIPRSRQETELSTSGLLFDGWGNIQWAGNFRVLLAASRRLLSIVAVNLKPKRVKIPDLALSRSADWILDVKRSPTNPAHVAVVTSTRLFWLNVTVTGNIEMAEEVHIEITVLLSWVHYRSSNDTSLHLELLSETEQALEEEENILTTVILYSRLTDLHIVYSLRLIYGQGRVVSASDPYRLQEVQCRSLDGRYVQTLPNQSRIISTLVLQPLDYGSLYGHPASGIAPHYMENGMKFFQMTVLYGDLSVSECLYVRSPLRDSIEIYEPNVKTRQEVSKTPLRLRDDFIVPDGVAHEYLLGREGTGLSGSRLFQDSPDPNVENLRTIDLGWLAEFCSGDFSGSLSSMLRPKQRSEPFEVALEMVDQAIEEKETSERPGTESLLELADISISVPDIDEAAARLRNFLNGADPDTSDGTEDSDNGKNQLSRVSQLLTSPMQLELGFPGGIEPQQIYSTLVQSYMTPLPRYIPEMVRVTLDRILRDIAVQVCLAAHTFSPHKDLSLEAQSRDAEGAPTKVFSLPMRRKASTSSLSRAKGKERAEPVSSSPSYPPPSSPVPEPTPSSQTGSRASSLAPTTPEDPASQRLRLLASMAPQPALPAKIAGILDHWTVGTDPASYDWAAAAAVATQQSPYIDVEGEDDDPQSQFSSQARKAKKRRKHAHERTDSWASARPPRDPAIVGRSQPAQLGSQPSQMGGSSGHSQAAGGTQDSIPVVTSQPDGGAHGDRKGKAKKGKGKVVKPAGFK